MIIMLVQAEHPAHKYIYKHLYSQYNLSHSGFLLLSSICMGLALPRNLRSFVNDPHSQYICTGLMKSVFYSSLLTLRPGCDATAVTCAKPINRIILYLARLADASCFLFSREVLVLTC